MSEDNYVSTEERMAESAGVTTRQRLILAAERLFAIREIEAVSLRQINVEAGQRNSSALHYHFGSREALIEAIFEYRMGPLDARRNDMLDELVATGLDCDLRSIIKAVVWPLAEQMKNDASGHDYVRFLARANQTPHLDLLSFVSGKYDHSLVRANRMISNILVEIPLDTAKMRILNVITEFSYSLSHLDQLIQDHRPDLRDEILLFTANDLIDRIAGGLAAPVSDATRSAYTTLTACLENGEAASGGLFGSPTALFGTLRAFFGPETSCDDGRCE